MDDKIIKVYMTYDRDTDNLRIVIKDRTGPVEIDMSTGNGITKSAMKEMIGNWIMDCAEDMIEGK